MNFIGKFIRKNGKKILTAKFFRLASCIGYSARFLNLKKTKLLKHIKKYQVANPRGKMPKKFFFVVHS